MFTVNGKLEYAQQTVASIRLIYLISRSLFMCT